MLLSRSEVVPEECSGRGRGECDCGQCVCHVQEELLRTVSLQFDGSTHCLCTDLRDKKVCVCVCVCVCELCVCV